MNKLEAVNTTSHAVNLIGLVTHQIENEINQSHINISNEQVIYNL
jgi:hypothetical protein